MVSGNGSDGILLSNVSGAGTGNVIAGNYVGIDLSGTKALPNTGVGVHVLSSGNTIGGVTTGTGNVLSGNQIGVDVGEAGITGNLIAGNLIGTDANGVTALPNLSSGVAITAGLATTVGGSTAGARNIISGNALGGVTVINGAFSSGTVIAGNYIGTDRTGSIALGNGSGSLAVGVAISSSGNSVGGPSAGFGNLISGNGGFGVSISGSASNLIAFNKIGTDATASTALANSSGGVVLDSSGGNTIGGGNVISGNAGAGILLVNAPSAGGGDLIVGNIIGLNGSANSAMPNAGPGVSIGIPNVTLGGTTTAARNVISGNSLAGVVLSASGTNALIQGNFIGTDTMATSRVPNGSDGITVSSSGSTIGGSVIGARNVISGNTGAGVTFASGGTNNLAGANLIGLAGNGTNAIPNGGDGVDVKDAGNTLGGAVGTLDNVISGNVGSGIVLMTGADNTAILGNYIGVAQSDVATAPNGGSGILVSGGTNLLIGGTTRAAGNVIAGNTADGIRFTEQATINALVEGNFIGVDLSGLQPNLGNGLWGISVEGSSGIQIGTGSAGSGSGAIGNTIAFNGASGIGTTGGVGVKTGSSVSIRNNSFYSNTGLGIDLGEDGVTFNSPPPHASGPNLLQNFPTLDSALSGPNSTSIQGTLLGVANQTYTIQFFASPTADPTGFGEGETFLGEKVVTADNTGGVAISASVPVHVDAGEFITATATDSSGNTSEFSQAIVSGNASTDLDITQSQTGILSNASPNPVQVGSTLTYTIYVTNHGPNPATGVTVTDTLPAGVTYLSASVSQGTVLQSGGIVTASFGGIGLAPNATATLTILVRPGSPGTLVDVASVTSNEGDFNSANNTVTLTAVAVSSADISATFGTPGTSYPTTALIGQPITYNLTVKNAGPSDAADVMVVEGLPSGAKLDSITVSQGTYTLSPDGLTITADLGALTAPGGSAVISVVLEATAQGSLTVNAMASADPEADPNPANNTATPATTTINATADLVAAVSPQTSPSGFVGQPFTFVVTATNLGPDDAQGVTIVDTLPANVKNVTVVASPGGTFTINGSTVNATFPSLSATAGSNVATLTITVTPQTAGVLTDSATVSLNTALGQGDPKPGNNTASFGATIGAAAVLGITLVSNPTEVSVGNDLQYQITVTNTGPNTATNVIVSDALPAGLLYQSVSQSQGTLLGVANGVVKISLGNIVSNGTATATITVRPQATADNTTFTTVTNTATVTSDVLDPFASYPIASNPVQTQIDASADVGLTIRPQSNSALVNGTVTYVITATNYGPSNSAGVQVFDTLPAGLVIQSYTSSVGTVSVSGQTVTANLGTLPATLGSNTAMVTITAVATSAGSLSNSAFETAITPDPVSTNNNATSSSVQVNPSASLTVFVTSIPDTVLIGQNVTYTILVGNTGPSTATGVTLTNLIPAGSTFVSATVPSGASQAINNGTFIAGLGTIPKGGQAQVTVTVNTTATGTLVDTASVDSVQAHPPGDVLTATASTTVKPSSDVTVTLAALPPTVLLGQPLTITGNVINRGPSAATGVEYVQTLPAGVTITSAKATLGTVTVSGQTVTVLVGNLPNGGLSTITLVVTPTGPGVVNTSATVTSIGSDGNEDNNATTASAQVIPAADLAITESASANPVALHGYLTYTLNVTNNGPSDATNVVLTDTLPSGVNFISANGPNGAATTPGSVLQIPIGSLSVGQTATVTIVIQPYQMGLLNDTASVSADQADTVASNSSNVQLVVVAGISGQLQFSAPSYSIGENGGSATIVVNRVGGTDGPVSVNYTTGGGSGQAGVNYTPVTGSLFFNDGETTKTFTVPVLDDKVNNGTQTVGLTLSNPAGGASIGSIASATLNILETDVSTSPTPITAAPLSVTSVRRYGIHEQPTQLVITFSDPIDATTAQDPINYTIVPVNGGANIGLVSAVYNATTSTVTLVTSHQLDVHKSYRLTIRGTGTGAIVSTTGGALGGTTANPTVGMDYQTTISFATLTLPTTAKVKAHHAVKATAHQAVKAAAVHPTAARHWASHLKARKGPKA